MLRKSWRIYLQSGMGVVLVLVLSGCNAGQEQNGTETPATARITGYATATPAPIPPAESAANPTGTVVLPTATPYIYTVVENDNLIWIAERFKLTLDQLIAANPGIDPRFLSVGTELIIPPNEGGESGTLPTPTPLSVTANHPVCYTTPAGGLWCFFLIENALDTALENLAGVVTLSTKSGEAAAIQKTAALLNRLPSGASIPLAVYFAAPVPAWEQVSGQVISAIAVPAGDERYLEVEAYDVEINIQAGGRAASVKGMLQLGAESPPAEILWVVAVAYDTDGLPVGLRRWESRVGMGSGERIPFAFGIYSVGKEIASIELLVEARPGEASD